LVVLGGEGGGVAELGHGEGVEEMDGFPGTILVVVVEEFACEVECVGLVVGAEVEGGGVEGTEGDGRSSESF
jgi:hypothetical protein